MTESTSMTKHDMDEREGGSAFLLGFIAGSVLGAGLALMLTPRTGTEMRREVADRAQQLGKRAAEQYEAASEKARDLADRGRQELHDAVDTAEQVTERALEAIEDTRARAEAGLASATETLRQARERLG